MPWEEDYDTTPATTAGKMPWEEDYEQGGSGRGNINPPMVNPNAAAPKGVPAKAPYEDASRVFAKNVLKGASLGLTNYLPGYHNAEEERQHPIAATAGNVAGSVGTAAATSGLGLLPQIGMGVVAGANEGYATRKNPNDAILGGILGGTFGAATAGLGKVMEGVIERAGKAWAGSQMKIAENPANPGYNLAGNKLTPEFIKETIKSEPQISPVRLGLNAAGKAVGQVAPSALSGAALGAAESAVTGRDPLKDMGYGIAGGTLAKIAGSAGKAAIGPYAAVNPGIATVPSTVMRSAVTPALTELSRAPKTRLQEQADRFRAMNDVYDSNSYLNPDNNLSNPYVK